MTREIFDYSKYGPNDYTYYGFHLKDGRYHIDTKRLKKLHCDGSFPEALFTLPRNTHYFVPRHKKYSDYAINVLLDKLNTLVVDWDTEYKSAIKGLTTPKQVYDNTRTEQLMYSSSPKDDMDDIEFNSLMESLRREQKYNHVIKSIHLQYLQKTFVEFFRTILLVIKERGYYNNFDFTYRYFMAYVQNVSNAPTKKANPIYRLPHYKYLDLLNKIDNFIKHNTIMSYNALTNNPDEKDPKTKKFLSSFVYTPKEMGYIYENGMYAGDWLKIGPNFVDEMLQNLKEFSKELCELLYKENADEAHWNSDETLVKILRDNFIDFM